MTSEKDPFGRPIDTCPPKIMPEPEARELMAQYAQEEAAQDAILGNPVGATAAEDSSSIDIQEEDGEWAVYLHGQRFGGFENHASASEWVEHFRA